MFALTKAGKRKKKLVKVREVIQRTRGVRPTNRQLSRLDDDDIDIILIDGGVMITDNMFNRIMAEPYISEESLSAVDTTPMEGDRIEPSFDPEDVSMTLDEIAKAAADVRQSMRDEIDDAPSRNYSSGYSSGSDYSSSDSGYSGGGDSGGSSSD